MDGDSSELVNRRFWLQPGTAGAPQPSPVRFEVAVQRGLF
jgi:hypothetical protein